MNLTFIKTHSSKTFFCCFSIDIWPKSNFRKKLKRIVNMQQHARHDSFNTSAFPSSIDNGRRLVFFWITFLHWTHFGDTAPGRSGLISVILMIIIIIVRHSNILRFAITRATVIVIRNLLSKRTSACLR